MALKATFSPLADGSLFRMWESRASVLRQEPRQSVEGAPGPGALTNGAGMELGDMDLAWYRGIERLKRKGTWPCSIRTFPDSPTQTSLSRVN